VLDLWLVEIEGKGRGLLAVMQKIHFLHLPLASRISDHYAISCKIAQSLTATTLIASGLHCRTPEQAAEAEPGSWE